MRTVSATPARAPDGVAPAFFPRAAGAGEVWSQSASVRRSEIPDQVLGVHVPHQWRDAPRLGWVNALLRATVWYDERVLGEHYSALTYYLWHESEVFQAPPEVARYVRAETPPDATLFGDAQSVPLVGLMTGRRLALDEADTNAMRFASGITEPRSFVARLEQAPRAVVLVADERGFVILPEFADWIDEHYTVVQTVDDPFDLTYRVYRRNGT